MHISSLTVPDYSATIVQYNKKPYCNDLIRYRIPPPTVRGRKDFYVDCK